MVIPVKDDAARLERCLEALWMQTRRPDEIVVVDNASSDLTRTVAAWWNAIYIYEAKPGIAAAASAGYDAASGTVIARLDADSVPGPEWVERICAAMTANPRLDAITGPGRFGSLPRPLQHVAGALYMNAYFQLFGALVGHTPLFGSNFAMRSEVWLAARGRTHRGDRHVHDDLDLSFGLDRGSNVELDTGLVVPISARPFSDPAAFVRRVGRGVYTVAVNRHLVDVPWRRAG